jgi:hypothetical protein
MSDGLKPSIDHEPQNLSTEHQHEGDAKKPSDTLDKGQEENGEGETIPRKSSLL